MKKNIFTVLAAFVFVICMGCFSAFGADVGDFSVSGDSGYFYRNNKLVITEGGSYEITMKDGVSSTETDKIKIASKEDVIVTIKDLNISAYNCSPFEIDSVGDVTILLEGNNSFTADGIRASALQKTSSENLLTITSIEGDGRTLGSLKAIVENECIGAGIGGGYVKNVKNITITGGTITARGTEAGIGGSYGGSGSYIAITGGSVSASSTKEGAGIGGGYDDSGEYITITGGSVYASAVNGSAIGGGEGGYGRFITITGGGITLSSEHKQAFDHYISGEQSVVITGGYFAEGNPSDNTVYNVKAVEGCCVETNTEYMTSVYPYAVTGGNSTASDNIVLSDSARCIQLTSAKFKNYKNLKNGYLLLDYYDGGRGIISPSVVLKPDGTELFKPGKYYITFSYDTHYDGTMLHDITYPQSRTAESIILRDIDTDLYGLMDMEGNILLDFEYSDISQYFDNYFTARKTEDGVKKGYVINGKTGATLYSYNTADYYYTDFFISEDEKYLSVWHTYKKDEAAAERKVAYATIDYDGNIIDSGETSCENLADYVMASSKNYDVLDLARDTTGTMFYEVHNLSPVDITYGTKYKYSFEDDDEESYENFVLRSVYLYNKTSYYAVYKRLGEDESEADFRPNENPSDWAEESINRLTAEGILLNSENCRYTDNISRLDFACLAVNIFYKANNIAAVEYNDINGISLNKERFADTDNLYALLACEFGITNPNTDATFSPARGISYDEAVTMLNSLADLFGVNINFTTADFTETDRPALSREQAYVCLCRIYEAAISQ